MKDDEERQDDPVLSALNTIIGEIRAIRGELDRLGKRLAGDQDRRSRPPGGGPAALSSPTHADQQRLESRVW
jgi:hypothetical protein